MSDEQAGSVAIKRPGLWRRALGTPVLELLRGRIRGSRAVTQQITDSGLSGEVRAVIERVVIKARLWPREERQVAGELIAHFSDGMEAGQTAGAMIEVFGDPDVAAKLIRRAKRHVRPWWWRLRIWAVRIATVCLLIFTLTVIGLWAYAHRGKPAPSPEGIRAMIASWPQDEQARHALAMLTEAEAGMAGWSAVVDKSDIKWDRSQDWPKQSAFLAAHQRELAMIREAAAAPAIAAFAQSPAPDDIIGRFWPYEVQTPLMETVRKVSRLLGADARRAVEAGDAEIAMADVKALLNLADHLDAYIRRPQDMYLHMWAIGATKVALSRQPELWSDVELQDLAHRLSDIPVNFRTDTQQLRVLFEHHLSCLYTRGGKMTDEGFMQLGLPWNEWRGGVKLGDRMAEAVIRGLMYFVYHPLFITWIGDRADQEREFERRLAEIVEFEARPAWEITSSDAARIDRRPSNSFRHWPVVWFLLDAGHLRQRFSTGLTAERDTTLTAIALELYRREHGDWPASLEDLTPRWLAQVPTDVCTGKPLRYRVIDGEAVLYSLGSDGDDDGGRAANDIWGWIPPRVDGDWILWTSRKDEFVRLGR